MLKLTLNRNKPAQKPVRKERTVEEEIAAYRLMQTMVALRRNPNLRDEVRRNDALWAGQR